MPLSRSRSFFFFNDTATTEIYTLSLHDALPICTIPPGGPSKSARPLPGRGPCRETDRKSTRLNSSHGYISYAVFCLKKKKKTTNTLNMKARTNSHDRARTQPDLSHSAATARRLG